MKKYDGSNQTIVVIDTGYNNAYKYPGEVVYQYDFADKDDDAFNFKSNHGSQVAQIASKEAAGADIIHLKVFGDGKWFAGGSDISDALNWTIENAEKYNISAVNMSLGYGNTTKESDTFLKDEFEKLADKDILTTVAAGNSYQHYGEGVTHYSADVNTIAVSATDHNGDIAYFSQRDKNLTDIFAQGQNVAVDNINGTHSVNGTSFAAPKIAGTIATVQEAAEDIVGHKLSQERMVDLMQMTGTRILEAPQAVSESTETKQTADGQALGVNSQITQIKVGGVFYSGDVVSVNVDGKQHNWSIDIDSGCNFLQAMSQIQKHLFSLDGIESVSQAKFNYGTNAAYSEFDITFKDDADHEVSVGVTDNNPYGNPTPLHISATTIREAVGEVPPEPIKDSPPPPVVEEPEAPTPPIVPEEPVKEIKPTPPPVAKEPVEEVVEEPEIDIPDDLAGDTFDTAMVLGVLKNDRIVTEHLSKGEDATDTFRFTIGDQNVNISVETNDNDIDLALYDKDGKEIEYDWNWGGDNVNIDRFLFEGQYYAKVINFDHDQETNYALKFDLNHQASEPQPEPDYAGYVVPDTQKMVDFIGQKYDGWDGWLFA
tara:strand:+ start:357 stop:2150 length:1794 start_codon:yes stop_codon:yes gene_type:complete